MSSDSRPTVLSGIQPSGKLTLGNYLGALKNWIALQDQYDCYYTLVDMHTITVRQSPEELRARCYEFLGIYLACGLDPVKSVLFVQSHVAAHARLAWVLNCYTQMGELGRMTQFKDKSGKHADNINAGLFDYPVLMAADILLYGAEQVPVGDDQKQHLELTRDVAMRFNNLYGETLQVPEPLIPKVGARIMGLQEPTAKMSKSDKAETNAIYLLDGPDVITRKLKRAVTDSEGEVRYDPQAKPGVANLLQILSAVTGEQIEAIVQRMQGQGYGNFKKEVADAVVALLEPLQQRYQDIQDDRDGLRRVLAEGAERASARADETLKKVHEAIGFIPEAARG